MDGVSVGVGVKVLVGVKVGVGVDVRVAVSVDVGIGVEVQGAVVVWKEVVLVACSSGEGLHPKSSKEANNPGKMMCFMKLSLL
jgi:hypothetical protein